jgi:serine protease Do
MFNRRQWLLGCGAGLSVLALPRRLAAAATGRAYRVPVDLVSRRLIVTCTIEGQGPFAFGIDTGGVVSMIDAALAARLKLRKRGKTGLGIAGRIDRYQMYEAREVVFGNAFRQQAVLLAGLEGLGLGRGVVGMLAAGCMTTIDAELDFVAKEWRLYPDGGPDRSGWVPHEDAIRSERVGSPHLFGKAAIGGEGLRCLLDTGAPSPTILRPKAARRCGIDLDAHNWSPAQSNGKEARVFRAPQPLEVGGLTLDRALVIVNEQAPSFVGDGIIGLPVIQRLNLATDVKRGLLWTRPNGLPPAPWRYNMSGLWIDRRGNGIVADRVGKGSPAEAAGIAPGDRLEGLAFGPLIARLNGPAGQQVPLRVAGRDVVLTLADYL